MDDESNYLEQFCVDCQDETDQQLTSVGSTSTCLRCGRPNQVQARTIAWWPFSNGSRTTKQRSSTDGGGRPSARSDGPPMSSSITIPRRRGDQPGPASTPCPRSGATWRRNDAAGRSGQRADRDKEGGL
jgi:hypothetical protein